jgi:hypothetical protein
VQFHRCYPFARGAMKDSRREALLKEYREPNVRLF